MQYPRRPVQEWKPGHPKYRPGHAEGIISLPLDEDEDGTTPEARVEGVIYAYEPETRRCYVATTKPYPGYAILHCETVIPPVGAKVSGLGRFVSDTDFYELEECDTTVILLSAPRH